MRGVNIGASKAKFEYAILDEDFDDIEGFTGAVLSSIERCGTIDIHPNGWGSHDYLGVNTANMHYMPGDYLSGGYGLHKTKIRERKPHEIKLALEQLAARKAAAADEESRRPSLIARDAREKHLYDWAYPKLLSFPHSTAGIAQETAVEFAQFGQGDARRRSITDDEWIWKRSRFMAGFK
jgi:hypothetical protein